MKRWIRTLAGKTVLFLVCILSLCVLAASVAGIVLYWQNGGSFYRKSEDALVDELLVNRQFRSFGYWILYNEINGNARMLSDFAYRIQDENGQIVSESEDFRELKGMIYAFSYGVMKNPETGEISEVWNYGYTPELQAEDFKEWIETPLTFYSVAPKESAENLAYYTVSLILREGTEKAMEMAFLSWLLHTAYALRYAVYGIALAALLAAIASFIALLYAVGRRPDSEELFPGSLHKLPFDLLFLLCAALGIVLLWLADELSYRVGDPADILLALLLCLVGLNMGLGLCMGAASRIKQRSLLKNTLIYRVLRLGWRLLKAIWSLLKKLHAFNMALLRGLPFVWKTGLITLGITLLELGISALAWEDSDAWSVLWFLEKLLLIAAVIYIALILRRLQKSGITLAGGDLSYHTDTKGMFWDFKKHGENLNSIAEGMALAVEERTKSERMKTELITNVSHDIKTPLTSIINYASLIGDEPCENPKIRDYSEVLVRQSEKLKRLIEDLVEASKASTGNMEVLLAPCDAATFLTQAGGEYEERLQSAGLTLITKEPEKELKILADGRRMWRIFDNLMNNIYKYAQPGTRVYLSLEEREGHALICFKNTSREPLDMTEEELMERFTRGDSSRNTEGNGLGLAIAKSMAELQGGSLTLSVDGDLFKASLSFPLIK